MIDPTDSSGAIRLPVIGARVVVRYLLSTGEATDALGELLSVNDQTVVVNGVRGVERIAVKDVVAAKGVPPRLRRRPRSS
ncbi:putative acetyltransferase [Demequina flava]|uniref:putative acetyltransferase n=1 Tax=Demequina flava TaxID=1095025 RepID=UPI003F6F8C0D